MIPTDPNSVAKLAIWVLNKFPTATATTPAFHVKINIAPTPNIDRIAKVVNYNVFRAENEIELQNIIKKIKKMVGPTMILVKIKKGKTVGGRVTIEPLKIKQRFIHSIQKK